MKITKNYNPWNEPIDRVWEVYSGIVNIPISGVKEYLQDTTSLEGKLPDGEFAREPTESEESILRGFDGDNFEAYQSELEDTVRERINDYLKRDNWGKSKGRIYVLPNAKEGEAELKACRDLAIAGALEKLTPGLFKLKTTVHERFIVNPVFAGRRR